MRVLIKEAFVIEPVDRIKDVLDILVEDGRIRKVSPSLDIPHAKVIDAQGMWAVSSITDCHVHLREPGFEYKETLKTGLMAAVKGGVTRVLCMPNTDPVNDDPSITRFLVEKSRSISLAKLYPIASITREQKGKEFSPFMLLKEAGAVAFSDDGFPVEDALVMRRALEYVKAFGGLIVSHCEVKSLSSGGVVNEGLFSLKTGLPPIPPESEVISVFKDVALCEYTGSRLHVAHVSLGRSLDVIKDAKGRGVRVSCETCPHYFLLSDVEIDPTDPDFKVNPPLRSSEDREAIRKAISNGIIDIIASDHAPHAFEDKFTDFLSASFGISGLETLVPLTLSLYHDGLIDEFRFCELLAVNPSRVFGLDYGGFREGSFADITLISPDEEWVVDPKDFVSKGKNTPFKGWKAKGKVKFTLVDGVVKFPFDWE